MPSDLAGRCGGAASCRPGRNTDLLCTLPRVPTPMPHTALGTYNCNRSIRPRRPVPRCIASCKLGSAGRRSEPVRGRQLGSFRSLVWSKLGCAPEPPLAAMMAGGRDSAGDRDWQSQNAVGRGHFRSTPTNGRSRYRSGMSQRCQQRTLQRPSAGTEQAVDV
jgi:hypothetical protein